MISRKENTKKQHVPFRTAVPIHRNWRTALNQFILQTNNKIFQENPALICSCPLFIKVKWHLKCWTFHTKISFFFARNDPSFGSIFAIITRDTQLCWPKSKMFKVAVPILGPFHAILFFSSILCFIWSLKILNDNRFGFFKSFFFKPHFINKP